MSISPVVVNWFLKGMSLKTWLLLDGSISTKQDGTRVLINKNGDDVVLTQGQMLNYNALNNEATNLGYIKKQDIGTIRFSIDLDEINNGYIFSSWGANRYYAYVSSELVIGLGDTGGISTGSGVIPINEHTTFHLTHDSGNWNLFREGLKVSSGTYAGAVADEVVDMFIGGRNSTTNLTSGNVNDIQKWNTVQSDSQILIDVLEPEVALSKALSLNNYYNDYLEDMYIPEYDVNNDTHVLITVANGKMNNVILNDVTKQHFFVEAGNYLSSPITLSSSGMQGNPRTLSLYNGNDDHPSKLSDAEQASINMVFDGANYWQFDRMSNIDDTNLAYYIDNGSSNNVFNRLHLKNYNYGFKIRALCHNNTIQSSYLNHMSHAGRVSDNVGIAISANIDEDTSVMNTKIINNDIRNAGDGIQLVHFYYDRKHDFQGTIVDSNRIWVDSDIYTNGDYSTNGYNPLGQFQVGENAVDLKSGSYNPDNPMIFTNNIMHGFRHADGTADGSQSVGVGTAFVMHYGIGNIIIEDNIIYDSQQALTAVSGSPNSVYSLYNASIKRNIFANIMLINPTDTMTYAVIMYEVGDVNFDNNIFLNIPQNSLGEGYFFSYWHSENSTFNRNVVINAHGTPNNQWGNESDNNYFYGSTQILNGTNDHTYATVAEANMDNSYFDTEQIGSFESDKIIGSKSTDTSPHIIDINFTNIIDKYTRNIDFALPLIEGIGNPNVYRSDGSVTSVVLSHLDATASWGLGNGKSKGLQKIKLNSDMSLIKNGMGFSAEQADLIVSHPLDVNYTLIEVVDGVHYVLSVDKNGVTTKYIDLVASVGTAVVGNIILNGISQISGLAVTNRTVFEIDDVAYTASQVATNRSKYL